jgi:hypothetical protein
VRTHANLKLEQRLEVYEIRKWLWLNFCVMWHRGYPFFFIFMFYLQHYFYILSSHLCLYFISRTSPDRYHTFFIKTRVFLSDTSIFGTSISKKKNYRTFTARLPHVRLCGEFTAQPHVWWGILGLHSEFVRLLFLQDHRETDRFFCSFRSSACTIWPWILQLPPRGVRFPD